jgi:TetR/AcrR family transcriptional regulator, transcriptional repressor of aconitase
VPCATRACLRESFDEAGAALTGTACSSPTSTKLPPDVLARLLPCVLPGYLLQVAISGADAVAVIPGALRELFPVAR